MAENSDGTIRIKLELDNQVASAMGAVPGGSRSSSKDDSKFGSRAEKELDAMEKAILRLKAKEEAAMLSDKRDKLGVGGFAGYKQGVSKAVAGIFSKDIASGLALGLKVSGIFGLVSAIYEVLNTGFLPVFKILGAFLKLMGAWFIPLSVLIMKALLVFLKPFAQITGGAVKAGNENPVVALFMGIAALLATLLVAQATLAALAAIGTAITGLFAWVSGGIALISTETGVSTALTSIAPAIAGLFKWVAVSLGVASFAELAVIVVAAALIAVAITELFKWIANKINEYNASVSKTKTAAETAYSTGLGKTTTTGITTTMGNTVDQTLLDSLTTGTISPSSSSSLTNSSSSNSAFANTVFGSLAGAQFVASNSGLRDSGGLITSSGLYSLQAGERVSSRGGSGQSDGAITVYISDVKISKDYDIKELARQIARDTQIELSRRTSYARAS